MTVEDRIDRVLADTEPEPIDHAEDCLDDPCDDCIERRAAWWERNMADY